MKTIVQKIKLPASARQLYDTYLDSKKHTAATGGKAVMSRKVGGGFKAWDGYLSGKNLLLVPGRNIVQTWRSVRFREEDLDSILSLTFEDTKGSGLITMVHANVPDHQAKSLEKGWHEHYWKPWKSYLKAGSV